MRVLIVRLGALGDIVHTLPVAAAIRRQFPDARLDWAIDERYAALLELTPVIDRRVVLHSRTLPGVTAWLELRRELRRVDYDVALDVQGLGKSAVVARLSGARRVVGFPPPFLRERWAAWLYGESADPGRPRHVVERNLGILNALGTEHREWEFPLEIRVPAVAEGVRRRLEGLGDRYVVINPNAAWPAKRWPPERYGAVAAHVARAHGLPSVVIWGPGDEARAGAVVAASAGAATPAPETSLAELAVVLNGGALVVSGDSGPLHVAAALGTPVVGIYGPSDPARNGPWSRDDRVVSAFADCACAERRSAIGPEGRVPRHCAAPERCLDAIAVEAVCDAVDGRLGDARAGHA